MDHDHEQAYDIMRAKLACLEFAARDERRGDPSITLSAASVLERAAAYWAFISDFSK